MARLKEKITKIKAQMRGLGEIEAHLQSSQERQVSFTDPDARSMATSRLGSAVVGYNVQTAVDAKHHLIVAHEVTNAVTDRGQLAAMAMAAKEATAHPSLIVLYRCPAGQKAIRRFTTVEDGKTLNKYWSSSCPGCHLKEQCTPAPYRRISRWEHEDVLEVVQARLDGAPAASRLRQCTVEHVFGTLKAWMGATHFRTRTLPRVRTEMSLQVLAYNLQRVIKILGSQRLIAEMRA